MTPAQILFPDAETFRHALESPRAPWLVTAFLIGLGCVYGVFVGAFQQALGGELAPGVTVADIPAYIVYGGNMIAGVLIILAVHVGITFASWLMAKAVGGPGHLTALYRTTAYLMPLALPGLPYVAAYAAAASLTNPAGSLPVPGLYLPLAGLAVALMLNGLYALYRDVQEVSRLRAGVATAGFAIFVMAILIIA
ncbi:MAG: hypothetical protein GVY13_00625 [Alphaproteobacteria bacterium]|jgi:hypothetical protein|nr:hypothetical protein [Alphaproteobacteria bacterium]